MSNHDRIFAEMLKGWSEKGWEPLAQWQNSSCSVFATDGKIDTAKFWLWCYFTDLIALEMLKSQCGFCLTKQKHYWNYFAFNQLSFATGKIASAVLSRYDTT